MEGHRGRAAIGVAELLVGSALAAFGEAEAFKDLDDLTWLEDREGAQKLSNEDRVGANEFGLEARLSIFEQELNHLAEVGL